MAGLGAPELLIVLSIVLLVFGGSKLPQLARSLGTAKREFEHGARHDGPAPEPPGDAPGAGRLPEPTPLRVAPGGEASRPGSSPGGGVRRDAAGLRSSDPA